MWFMMRISFQERLIGFNCNDLLRIVKSHWKKGRMHITCKTESDSIRPVEPLTLVTYTHKLKVNKNILKKSSLSGLNELL